MYVRESAKGLQHNKDSRILWTKDDFLLTTGFDMMRSREVRLWDSRKLSSSVSSVSLGTSSGRAVYFSKHGCRGQKASGSVAALQRGEERNGRMELERDQRGVGGVRPPCPHPLATARAGRHPHRHAASACPAGVPVYVCLAWWLVSHWAVVTVAPPNLARRPLTPGNALSNPGQALDCYGL
eukprot:superscaffoldBa00004564_g19091